MCRRFRRSVGGSSKNLGIVSNGDGIVLINNNEFTQNTTSAVLSVEIKTACNIDLTLIKTVDKPIVYVGSKIVFSIKLKNTSFFNASEIKVKDLLPEDLSFDVECSEIPENTTYDSQIGIWDLKNTVLKGNEEITLKICAVVTKSNSLIINKTEILSVKENDSDSIANTGN